MIHGLLPSLAESGRIKLGKKGKAVTSKDGKTFRLPEKLSYFLLTTTEKDQDTDDYIIDTEIMDILKKNGKAAYNADGKLVGIPIRLLYNDIDMNLSTQYVSYVGGLLACSGDGQEGKTRDGRKVKCPCGKLDNSYVGNDKCKLYSVLSVLIEGARIGTCYKLRTTSNNTARHLISSMILIKTRTGGLLAFIPLQLVVRPKKTIIPSTGAPVTVYVASLEYPGSEDELREKALKMGAESVKLIANMRDIEAEAKKFITPIDNINEEFEIATEFFPNSIELKPETKKIELGQETKKLELKPEIKKKVEPNMIDVAKELDVRLNGEKATNQKITKKQLEIILDLKTNILNINNKDEWTALIKSMKNDGVEKANDMTSEQGDELITYLKAIAATPTHARTIYYL